MAERQPHPPEVKARVMSQLATGASARSLAEESGIPLATVRAWRQQLRREDLIRDPQKKDELSDLVFAYLTEALTTLSAQVRFSRDEDWLRRQNASDLAILHGVLQDKAVRLLAALQPSDDPDYPALGE